MAADYFGPIPPNNPPPADITGATLCRSEAYHGTAFGTAHGANGHMDTMSLCGIFSEVPAGAQAEAYPSGGAYSFEGYPIKAGQVIRLHCEYQNNSGAPKTDVMGIMAAWMAFPDPGYPRPQGRHARCGSRWCPPTTSARRPTAPMARRLPGTSPELLQPARPDVGPAHGRVPRRQRRARANFVGSARMVA